jgi:hypothetical protein
VNKKTDEQPTEGVEKGRRTCMRGGQERGETTEPLQSSHDLAMVGSNWRAMHDQKSGSQEIERNGKTGNPVGEASKVA